MSHLSYFQAIFVGLLQGVTELFPVSSLGHGILIPALIGGDWAKNLDMSADGSPYLTFIVAVHVATAVALVVFFRHDWLRIASGLISSLRTRRMVTVDQRLAWLLLIASIPVGIAGIALDHLVRTTLGRPVPAALFLTLNGVVLYTVERLRGRTAAARSAASRSDGVPVAETDLPRLLAPAPMRAPQGYRYDVTVPAPSPYSGDARGWGGPGSSDVRSGEFRGPGGGGGGTGGTGGVGAHGGGPASDARLARLSWGEAFVIGAAQVLALLPGISRSGSTIAAGLLHDLDHEDAARFAFLLATPAIAGAGLLKLPELAGPSGHGILGQVLVGSLVAGIAAYISLRWLTRYFETSTLTPFAIYCTVAGLGCLAWFTVV
jgi:undecaprenyl-diphosphatase